jgi:hypothetical protein
VQIDKIDDVSCAAYSTLQDLCGTRSDNSRISFADDGTQAGVGADSQIFTQLFAEYTSQQQSSRGRANNSSSRLIMLQLSDGVRSVVAFERKLVPELNMDLPLGTKVSFR